MYKGDDLAILLSALTVAIPFVEELFRPSSPRRFRSASVALLLITFGFLWPWIADAWPEGKAAFFRTLDGRTIWLLSAILAMFYIFFRMQNSKMKAMRTHHSAEMSDIRDQLRRYVIPRRLAHWQTEAITEHLLRYPPAHKIRIAFRLDDQEASLLAMQLGNAFHLGNWEQTTLAFRDNEGPFAITGGWFGLGTWNNGEGAQDQKRMETILREALERANLSIDSGMGGSHNKNAESGFWLIVGKRPYDLSPPVDER